MSAEQVEKVNAFIENSHAPVLHVWDWEWLRDYVSVWNEVCR